MKYKIILLMIAFLYITGCGNTPIFTEMKNSRLKIVIKGTLETENQTSPFSIPTANDASMEDDSVSEVVSPAEDTSPATFMLDIAEIRLGGKKISNYRQVFSIPLNDSQPFFNGTGIELITDDPGDGNYDSVQIYLRKMIFDNAKIYQLTGNSFDYEDDAEVIFNEETVNGFDFNQLMVNSYWDSLRLESSEVIRIFPVQIPIVGGMTYSKVDGETVLEIRLVIKNFVKKFEYPYYDEGVYKVCHYYALSDWLRDVREGETDIGRNLHAVARSYVTGKTGSITVTNGSGGYVVAIPAGETLSDYYITSDGSSLRTAVGDSDLPVSPTYPGSYIEPVLDYYLKYEKYKSDWNTQVTTAALDLTTYESVWDIYEEAVHGDPDGVNNFGLKIPPYVGYGNSVTFSNMAPGTYNFYRLAQPSYGKLFVAADDAAFTAVILLSDKVISEGSN